MTEDSDALELVDLAEYAERREPVPYARRYRVRIDGEHHHVDSPQPLGSALLTLVHKRDCAFELIEEFRDGENNVIEPGATVDLRKKGLCGFITAHRAVVKIELENTSYEVERGPHTVAQILALASKDPEGFELLEERNGPPMPVPEKRVLEIQGCEVFFFQVKSGGSS